MASRTLFSSVPAARAPAATVFNHAGGKAYALSDKAALAKVAMTGTLGTTFYVSEKAQLDESLKLADKVDPEFLAKTAIFAAERGFMKDLPALLAAKLSTINPQLLARVFPRVIKNGKMLRNFVQIIRSGQVGRRSLGTAPKRLIQNFLNGLPDRALLNASVGESPSLADVIKLSHPKPTDDARKAFYGYLIDREVDKNNLPEIVKKFEAWKKNPTSDIPEVDFRLLTSAQLNDKQWKDLALNANWQTLRQGLNMFHRHKVFTDTRVVSKLADKLRNEDQIRRAKVFPYQLFSTFINMESEIPVDIRNAVQDAAEVATGNIPEFPGKIYIFIDRSGSMGSSITGYRAGATSKMRCVDIAALTAAAVLRKNPKAVVIPFDTSVYPEEGRKLNPKDSIMTNATKLRLLGGGTDCSSGLRYLNSNNLEADLVWYVSDSESWYGAARYGYGGTGMAQEWETFKVKNPNARLVSLDITPNTTSQVIDRTDVMNVGGFSDVVFDIVAAFHRGDTDGGHLASIIDSVQY